MSVSRDTFDKIKNYTQVQFNKDVPLLDSELNELQQIQNNALVNTRKSFVGTSMVGDDLKVFPGVSANSIIIKSGVLFHEGIEVPVYNDVTVSLLSTPVSDRHDTVFVEFEEIVVDETTDPNLVDPDIGFPTTQRKKIVYSFHVNECSLSPNPSPGKYFVKLATLNRIGGNVMVTAPEIQDDRSKSANTYVVRGCHVTKTTAFQASVASGHVRVGSEDFFYETAATFTFAPSSITYLIAQDETIQQVSSIPANFPNPLAKVTTDGTGIITIEDLRKFQPLIYQSQASAASDKIPPENPDFDSDEHDGVSIFTYEASVVISKFQVVCSTVTPNTVTLASNLNISTTPVVAIAIMDVAVNNLGTFLKRGPITNPAWNWIVDPNKPIFLGVNGTLTQTPPVATDTVIQIVGVPISSTTMDFNPSFITIRN